MLLRCRSHKGTALPWPPRTGAAPVLPSPLGVRLHDRAVGLEYRAAFMASRGSHSASPSTLWGGEWWLSGWRWQAGPGG